MKKFRTIISALAAAAVITTIPAQAAIEVYNPITRTFDLADFLPNAEFSDFIYKDVYSSSSLVLGIESDEDGNVINDTYNNGTDKYWYAPKDAESKKLNVFSTCGTDYNIYGGTSGNEISRYASVYGRMHTEAIVRFTDSAQAGFSNTNEGLSVLGFKKSGGIAGFTIYPNYINQDGTIQISAKGAGSEMYINAYKPGTWLKFSIDVDVPNDAVEFTVTDLSANKEIVRKQKLSACGEEITNIVCGARMRFSNTNYGISIAKIATTRDTFVVDDFSVTDSEKVTASAKMANHGSNGNYRFSIVNSDGTQTPMYDATAVANLCKKTPMLILAQYDSEGRLLDCRFNKPESLTSTFGAGQFYINPTHVENKSESRLTEKVDWQNVSIECDKSAGYSYAKAYVWTGLDSQKPYLESVSTQQVTQ